MTSTITIEVDDRHVTEVLRELLYGMDDMTPVMQRVGTYLVESTKRRFVTSTSPDGTPWQRNSPVTYLRMIEQANKALDKTSHLNAKGSSMAMAKKPLIGETRRLSREIAPNAGRDSVSVGSALIYAATQQFGAAQGAFGRTSRGGPIPWGNIPPRPFLGMNEADDESVLAIVQGYLAAFAK